ncbi:DUF6011 domain-containing protein [Streptomyces sp. BPPL-273]|uniref:DUF6011 domain-containing protein n=1 Tax=Streptomyces sp. BPPL-273 TaxID=2987533 RepID=UPI0024AFA970|nr:DUF6011 domain-containing protein [Streptomyces sp. BPPL-273]WHM30267.1 DUF6011 domain-containing protein [Streptomyces sp. BPPL-273]
MPGRRLCEGGCGRWLTTPASVALGYGRVCAERHGIPTRRRTVPARPAPARVAEPAVAHCDGQTEIELQPMQPSLWAI